MSINWVMLQPSQPSATTTNSPPFTPLPREHILYTSPPRTSLTISTPAGYIPGRSSSGALGGGEEETVDRVLNMKGQGDGVTFVTNQRIIHLPSSSTSTSISLPSGKLNTTSFTTFSSPLSSITDSRTHAPFFGANAWVALCRPVRGGGLDTLTKSPVLELRLTFKEGGAFEWQSRWEEVRERVRQVREVGSESGGGESGGQIVDHLEQLPAYEPRKEEGERAEGRMNRVDHNNHDEIQKPAPQAPVIPNAAAVRTPSTPITSLSHDPDGHHPPSPPPPPPPPNEPPPGYEEAQMQAVDAAAAWREEGSSRKGK